MTTSTRSCLVCLLLLSFAGCSHRRPDPGPVNRDEYAIYSSAIVQYISSSQRTTLSHASAAVSDSTDNWMYQPPEPLKPSDQELGDKILQAYLLEVDADTFQIAPLRRSFVENNPRHFPISNDSIRHYFALGDSSAQRIALLPKTHRDSIVHRYYTDTTAYMFSFSRAGFNSNRDQAVISVHCLHYLGFQRYNAYFIKKHSQWRLVKTITESSGHLDFF
jgi:hypothetical protein